MNSRIETLVDTFDVRDRLIGNMGDSYFNEIDYPKIQITLQEKMKDAYGYLMDICDCRSHIAVWE